MNVTKVSSSVMMTAIPYRYDAMAKMTVLIVVMKKVVPDPHDVLPPTLVPSIPAPMVSVIVRVNVVMVFLNVMMIQMRLNVSVNTMKALLLTTHIHTHIYIYIYTIFIYSTIYLQSFKAH